MFRGQEEHEETAGRNGSRDIERTEADMRAKWRKIIWAILAVQLLLLHLLQAL